MASSKSRRASFGRIHDQVRPASIRLHGRGGVQLERLREIFDGAGILAQLGPGQTAAAIDRLERLARLEVAVERLDDLVEPAQPEQRLRPQPLSQRMVLAQRQRRVERSQRFGVLPAAQEQPPTFDWSSTWYGLLVSRARSPGRGCASARSGSLRSR